jgi:putative transcriptional regulator
LRNDLRQRRAEREWSQGDLAEKLGVSRQTINAIETGRYMPSLPLAFALARHFGTTVDGLFHPDPEDMT